MRPGAVHDEQCVFGPGGERLFVDLRVRQMDGSFNVFIGPTRSREPNAEVKPGPLAALAAERGKTGHQNLAVQMIGGSTPMQHWNQGDGDEAKNIAKVALHKGGLDVFTMSPNARMPEEGIDLFGDLVIKRRKGTWNPYGKVYF